MDGREFWDKVHNHKDLKWMGVREGDTPDQDVVIIKYDRGKHNAPIFTELVLGEIRKHIWDHLEMLFLGRRKPESMKHITRIVGYYSYTYNWNGSKMAELHDRRKGNYGVPEAA